MTASKTLPWHWHPGPARERLDRALVNLAEAGQIPPCGRWDEEPAWTSDNPAQRAQAAILCASCPLTGWCYAGAVEEGNTFGVWGGIDFTGITKSELAQLWATNERTTRD